MKKIIYAMWKYMWIFVIISIFYTAAIAQSTHNDTRCFQFTWLGPRYDNQSVFMNATCSDATQLAEGVPCQHPLVVSEDGTWPDIDYIWTHHFADTTCTLSRNDVCAKYTFYFNGHPENATYMCTRAVDTLDTAITSGCYEQTSGSYRTRVCFCRSVPGGVPCNKAPTTQTTLLTSLISIFSIFTFISFRFSTLLM